MQVPSGSFVCPTVCSSKNLTSKCLVSLGDGTKWHPSRVQEYQRLKESGKIQAPIYTDVFLFGMRFIDISFQSILIN